MVGNRKFSVSMNYFQIALFPLHFLGHFQVTACHWLGVIRGSWFGKLHDEKKKGKY